MKSIEESVVSAMDGTDKDLFSFLPYIFQDAWEIGASPETINKLIRKHSNKFTNLKLLDLGCGKGAVSIKAASEFGCKCLGIDAVEEFIEEARRKAVVNNVNHLCRFEQGDIRIKILEFSEYDVVVLGAVGNVLGNYFTTLTKLSKCIKADGKIIIDDAYIEDENNFTHPAVERRSSIFKQSKDAGMRLVDEIVARKSEIEESEDYIFEKLKSRCEELMKKYPMKRNLFQAYIQRQTEESEILKQKVTCSTMLFGN